MSLLSLSFAMFLALAVGVCFVLPGALQPRWLLACRLFYYCCADWRYLPFLLISALSVWLAGLALEKRPGSRLIPAAGSCC